MGRHSVLITAALVAVAGPISIELMHQGICTTANSPALSAAAPVQRRYPGVPAQPMAAATLLASVEAALRDPSTAKALRHARSLRESGIDCATYHGQNRRQFR